MMMSFSSETRILKFRGYFRMNAGSSCFPNYLNVSLCYLILFYEWFTILPENAVFFVRKQTKEELVSTTTYYCSKRYN